MALIAALLHLDLRFMDAQAMGVVAFAMVATGLWQRRVAKKLEQVVRASNVIDLRRGRAP